MALETIMRMLLLLPLLLTPIALGQNAGGVQEDSLVVVLDFKHLKSRQTIKNPDSPYVAPAPDMSVVKKNDLRNPLPRATIGVIDPNTQTTDGRAAALERNVQEARSPKSTSVEGYIYQAKIRNVHNQNIEIVFWEYQFKELSNPTNVVRRQFLCSVKIKPGKERELQAFTVLGPSDVISVGSLTNKSRDLFEEKVLINRMEYADGTIFQRKDWNYAEMKPSIERAIRTPWGSEMCRSL
jgi:hypothetical protein